MPDNFFAKLFSRPPLDQRTPVQLTKAVKTGDRKALESLEKFAHDGLAAAQLELGFLYAKGIGLPQSFSNAAIWYVKAADQGVPNAQYNLGIMYYKGEGVDQDWTLATACFEKAASQGHEQASQLVEELRPALRVLQEEQALNNMLGLNVVAGINDETLAKRYLLELKEICAKESVRSGLRTHLIGLGVAISAVSEVERCVELAKNFSSVTSAPVDEILQMAADDDLEMILSFAAKGNEDLTSLYNKGVMYLNGHGDVPRDLKKAYETFRSAAERGHARAQYNLGIMYSTGTHVEESPASAASWLAKAAANGHANAAFNLANLYLTGSGVEKDSQQAHLYLCMAADRGHVEAMEYVHKFLASKGLDSSGVPLR